MFRAITVFALALAVGSTACSSANDGPSPSQLTAPTAPSATGGPGQSPHSAGTVIDGAHGEVVLTPEMQQAIGQLRARMAAFHNFDKAVEAGYSVAAPAEGVCLSDPVRGGMGFHYTRGDKDLISDGRVDLFEPEFLVYAPTRNGDTRFAALDYFVPYSTWTDDEPPSLLGVPFAREDNFGAWVLHIWLFWPNPSGIFANYNPDVPLC